MIAVCFLFTIVSVFSVSEILPEKKQEMKKPYLAVLDFEMGSGISRDHAGVFSEFLRTNMVNTELFHLIEREQINEILKIQNLHQATCTSSTCAVEIGQLLAAEKIMTGKISKIDGIIYINAKITDVGSGRIEFSENLTGSNTESLDKIAQSLSIKFAARIQGLPEYSPQIRGKKTRVSMLWRSAVLPGWGHLYNEQVYSGLTHMFLFTAMAMSYNYYDRSFIEESKNPFKDFSKLDERYRSRKNKIGVAALSYYFLQLAHAYISGRPDNISSVSTGIRKDQAYEFTVCRSLDSERYFDDKNSYDYKFFWNLKF